MLKLTLAFQVVVFEGGGVQGPRSIVVVGVGVQEGGRGKGRYLLCSDQVPSAAASSSLLLY